MRRKAAHWYFITTFLWLLFNIQAIAQIGPASEDSSSYYLNKKKLRLLTIGGGSIYGGSLLILNHMWYSNMPRTSFHFFDDRHEWLQVDKLGHTYTAYHLNRVGTEALHWTGMTKKKAVWLGALTGIILLTPIEILDGFSSKYGASWSDQIANISGSALFLGQYLLWNEIRIQPKFSFHQTNLAQLRPNTLGKGAHEELLKDYNGQTYWFSANIRSFIKKETRFPSWLNLAVGYGAQDMVFALEGQNLANGHDAFRQYYLSLDLSLTSIHTNKKLIKILLFALDAVKIPTPTLEWNRKQGWKFHTIYF